jgi:hypothetical protein
MKKRLVLLVVVVVAIYAVVRWRSNSSSDSPPTTTDDRSIALDRLWIDHLPQNPRDEISIFAALTDEHQPIGIHQKTSQWRGSFEIFQFEAKGDKLAVVYPQTGDKETVRVKARACDEHGWDYCLVLEGSSRGVKKYYSIKGWELRSQADEENLVHQLYTTGK